MRSREIFALFGAAGLARVVDARGEQTTTPVVVFLHSGSLSGREGQVAAFLQGLADGGYIAGKSVVIGRTMWSTRSMLDRATPAEMSRSDVSRRHQCPFPKLAAAVARLGSGFARSSRRQFISASSRSAKS